MENNGYTFMYQLPDPPFFFSDPNEYFVRYAQEKNLDYFNSFLHHHEKAMNHYANSFLSLYALPTYLLADLKQLYAYTVWNEMRKYDPNDPIPLLQKVKYPILHTWHGFVRTTCGTVTISKPGTYKRLQQVARLYFRDKELCSEKELIENISKELDMSEKGVWEMILLAHEFRFPLSLEMDRECFSSDENGKEPFPSIHRRMPPTPSAEAEYFRRVMRKNVKTAIQSLWPKDLLLLELLTNVCANCFQVSEGKRTYQDIALILGYASESSVAKRKDQVMRKLRRTFSILHNQLEPDLFPSEDSFLPPE